MGRTPCELTYQTDLTPGSQNAKLLAQNLLPLQDLRGEKDFTELENETLKTDENWPSEAPMVRVGADPSW